MQDLVPLDVSCLFQCGAGIGVGYNVNIAFMGGLGKLRQHYSLHFVRSKGIKRKFYSSSAINFFEFSPKTFDVKSNNILNLICFLLLLTTLP